jgi:hypothetical protein
MSQNSGKMVREAVQIAGSVFINESPRDLGSTVNRVRQEKSGGRSMMYISQLSASGNPTGHDWWRGRAVVAIIMKHERDIVWRVDTGGRRDLATCWARVLYLKGGRREVPIKGTSLIRRKVAIFFRPSQSLL